MAIDLLKTAAEKNDNSFVHRAAAKGVKQAAFSGINLKSALVDSGAPGAALAAHMQGHESNLKPKGLRV